MRDPGDPGGRNAFMGFALVILAGLLFAAGVMVGRQMQPEAGEAATDPLGMIDERDRRPAPPLDGGELTFHEELSKPVAEPATPAPPPPRTPVAVDAGSTPRQATPPEAPTQAAREPEEPSWFSLQIASYREKGQAERLMQRLAERGYTELKLLEGMVPGKGTFHRVRMGPFSSRDTIESLRARLERSEGLEALVVREDGP